VAYAPERCKDGKVVGIVTDRDVTCRTVARGLYPTQTTMVGILSQVDVATRASQRKAGHMLATVRPQPLAKV